MKVKSHYIRERYIYSEDAIRGFFADATPEQVKILLSRLEKTGILRKITKSDRDKLWSELADDLGGMEAENENNSSAYIFDFVGVICLGGYVFKCYPKYMKPGIEPLAELKQIIRVIERVAAKNQDIKGYEYVEDAVTNSLLSLLLFLLNDYHENGLYRNELNALEINGSGGIDWDKTINETYPVITDGQPYYVELFTRKRIRDDSDFFYRLHGAILTKISKELEEADLDSLFDVVTVELSEEKIDDFGNTEYILGRIEKELRVQFNTHKQMLLRAMQNYIEQQGALHDDAIFTIYGTNSFHTVWELVCAEVFGNVLNASLSDVARKLGVTLADEYQGDAARELKELMPKPVWNWPGAGRIAVDDTLRLDFVSVCDKGGQGRFVIFDAKYYTPQLVANNKLSKMPGIADVTKQYFYQLAFMPFLMAHKVNDIRNCFLMPMQYYTDEHGDFSGYADVEIAMFHQPFLKKAALQKIQVRFLHPAELYECYLSGRLYPVDELKL